MVDFTLRPLTVPERKYTYAQSSQLQGQTGNIGYLRGDFGSSGDQFYTTWFDTRPQWKSDEFKRDLDDVINALRSEEYGLLQSRSQMVRYGRENKESEMQGAYTTEFGFRADTEKYAFVLRCNPTRGDYNFYCLCYVKEWLDKHIEEANRDIRFIDSHYNELFRIPDGERIIVTDRDGKTESYPCRYIDSYHTGLDAISFTFASLPSVWSKAAVPTLQWSRPCLRCAIPYSRLPAKSFKSTAGKRAIPPQVLTMGTVRRTKQLKTSSMKSWVSARRRSRRCSPVL